MASQPVSGLRDWDCPSQHGDGIYAPSPGFYNRLYGDAISPPKISSKLTQFPDGEKCAAEILAAQGTNLCSPPDTPVWPMTSGEVKNFVTLLDEKLGSHLIWQTDRACHYSDAVLKEWPMRMTPAAIVEARADYIARLRFQFEYADSDSDSDTDTDSAVALDEMSRSFGTDSGIEKPKTKLPGLVVETQGACLVTRPDTPVQKQKLPDEKFAYKLTVGLLVLQITMHERCAKLGDRVGEWRVGHTPPSVAKLWGYGGKEKDYYSSTSPSVAPEDLKKNKLQVSMDSGRPSREFAEVPQPSECAMRPRNVSIFTHADSSSPDYAVETQSCTFRLPITPKLTASPDSDTGVSMKRSQENSNAADDANTPDSETGRPRKMRVVGDGQIPSGMI